MPKRIQILACSFALGVAMLLLGATAAQAAPGETNRRSRRQA